MTRRDLYNRRSEYLRLVDEVQTTWAGELDNAHMVARQNLTNLVQDMAAKGYIPDKLAREVLEQGAKPGKSVADYLEEAAQTAARDVDLGPEEMAKWADLGYKPVVTGEDVLQLHEVDQYAEAFGVGDYTRRAAVWDTLGLSPRWARDQDLFMLRVAHERSELEQVFTEEGIALNGTQALTRLRNRMNEINHEGVVKGPIRFKTGKGIGLYKNDVRQLSPEEINAVFQDIDGFNDTTAMKVYGALKRGAAYGGEAKLTEPLAGARQIGHALRIAGLPGFADFMRTAKLPVTSKTMAAVGGAGVGAATGYLLGDEKGQDALRGAILGAGLGLGARQITKASYGYLPEKLANLNMALRYTFSFTFDAGRYTEQNMLAATMLGLPPILAPKRYVMGRGPLKSPYMDNNTVQGEEAWKHATAFWDEINGTKYFQHLDDTDRRMFQTGMLGFSPRNHEAAQAFMLYQRGMSKDAIRESISKLGRYGLGRTAAEKSANFVMFPFSFSKKLITSLGDFVLQAPGRNLLITEGLRRYHESSMDESFHTLIEDHLPLLEQLAQVNNLAFGISPGRFFLEGLDDHRSAVGKVSQILASVFVPSGAATPLAQAAGGLGDLAVHAFTPLVITGESIDRAGGVDGLDDIIRRYIPMVREIDQYFVQGEGGKLVGGAVGEQLAAATSPGFNAPYAQLTGYLDEQQVYKDELTPVALALGYSSAEGLLASDIGGAFALQYEQKKEKLRERYPSGAQLMRSIDDSALVNDAALADLAKEDDRSAAEDEILNVAQRITALKQVMGLLQLPAEVSGAVVGVSVRNIAKQWSTDRRFAELWDRFFAREYGPIQAIAPTVV